MSKRKRSPSRQAKWESVIKMCQAILLEHGHGQVFAEADIATDMEKIASVPVLGRPTSSRARIKVALSYLYKSGKWRNRMQDIWRGVLVEKQPQPETKKKGEQEVSFSDKAKAFYKSYDWKRMRYSVLEARGRKCECCGETEGVMQVDHIKPLRKHWELRLDVNNLQVLCSACNHGKGNWDETDWRLTPEGPAPETVVN